MACDFVADVAGVLVSWPVGGLVKREGFAMQGAGFVPPTLGLSEISQEIVRLSCPNPAPTLAN